MKLLPDKSYCFGNTTIVSSFSTTGNTIFNSHIPLAFFLSLTLFFMMADSRGKRHILRQNKSKKIKKNYYAVIGSHKSGIYTSYNEANKFVKGVSGASLVGRETLKEAKKDLISCGYPDPIVYDFRRSETGSDHEDNSDEERISSVSDSESQIDVYAINDDTLFDLPDENRVLTFNQPLGGKSYQNTLRSSSSDSCQLSASTIKVISVPTKCSKEKTENIGLDDSGEITLNPSGSKDFTPLDNLSHQTFTKEVWQEPNIACSPKKSSKEPATLSASNFTSFENQLMASMEHLFKSTNDTLHSLHLEVKSLHADVQAQKDLTSKVIEEVKEIHKENQHLSLSMKKDIKALTDKFNQSQNIDICEQSEAQKTLASIQEKEILMTNRWDEIIKDSSDMKTRLDKNLSTNEKLINDVEHITLITQQLVLKVENQSDQLETSNSNQSKMMNTLLDHDVLSKQLILSIEKQNEKLDSLKLPAQSLKANDKFEDSVQDTIITIHKGEKITNTDAKSIRDNEHDIIHHHPAFLTHSLTSPSSQSTPLPTLRLPESCLNVLIGDSNTQSVNKKSLDQKGATEIRTFRGSSFRKVHDILCSTDNTFPNVRNVAFCLGSVDCNKNYINFEQIVHDVDQLISVTKKVFPSASISIISIAPQSNPKSNCIIMNVNKKLGHHFRNSYIHFLKSENLWRHVDDRGFPVSGMVLGKSQLSNAAVYLLMQSVKNIFSKSVRFVSEPSHKQHLLQRQTHGDSTTQQDYLDPDRVGDDTLLSTQVPSPLSSIPNSYTIGTGPQKSSIPDSSLQQNGCMIQSSPQQDSQQYPTTEQSSSQFYPHHVPKPFGISNTNVLPNIDNQGAPNPHPLSHFRHMPLGFGSPFNPEFRFSNSQPMQYPTMPNMFAMNSLLNPYLMGNVPFPFGCNPHTYLSPPVSAANFTHRRDSIKNNAETNPTCQQNSNQ